jgi:hypothetical protein
LNVKRTGTVPWNADPVLHNGLGWAWTGWVCGTGGAKLVDKTGGSSNSEKIIKYQDDISLLHLHFINNGETDVCGLRQTNKFGKRY